jgi:hypothetical protein
MKAVQVVGPRVDRIKEYLGAGGMAADQEDALSSEARTPMTSIAQRHRLARACGAAVLTIRLAACGKQDSPAPAAGASAAATRVYSVGTDAAYAPFESQNEKGEIVGFDIDIVRAVARRPASRSSSSTRRGKASSTRSSRATATCSSRRSRSPTSASSRWTSARPYFDAHQLIAGQGRLEGSALRRPEEPARRRADRTTATRRSRSCRARTARTSSASSRRRWR